MMRNVDTQDLFLLEAKKKKQIISHKKWFLFSPKFPTQANDGTKLISWKETKFIPLAAGSPRRGRLLDLRYMAGFF